MHVIMKKLTDELKKSILAAETLVAVRLWVTSVETISIDVTNVIENACSDLHENAYERCDEGSLQKLLDDWCKEQTGTTTYYPCFKQYVEIDWSKYSEE